MKFSVRNVPEKGVQVFGFEGSPKTPEAALQFAEKAQNRGDEKTARDIRKVVYKSSYTKGTYSPRRK